MFSDSALQIQCNYVMTANEKMEEFVRCGQGVVCLCVRQPNQKASSSLLDNDQMSFLNVPQKL